MARNIITGIDIGTHTTRVVVTEFVKGRVIPRIIGVGSSETKGLRHGYIINHADTARSIAQAIKSAEKNARVPIKSAYLSIGGISLESIVSNGQTIISRADSEVTELDVKNVLAVSKENAGDLANKRILDIIPLKYKLDGKDVLTQNPEGMQGARLEVKTLFITCLEQHFADLVHIVENIGVETEDVIASPIAASLVALTKKQRAVGCVLANIGAETVSIVVFEDDIPTSVKVFPIGSTDITNDIALGFSIPLEEAERLKKGDSRETFPKKKLDEIIEARLSDIFELIELHLKKIGRNGLLPAGIIITGGGAGVSTIADLAKATLNLPSTNPQTSALANQKDRIADSSWFVAYGLSIYGANQERNPQVILPIGGIKKKVLSWFKQLLP
ncbi:MAG TPA: cell division protein FtsA [Candidatus Yonathbacteria bacterium]|nr:cell division protein FtsA [Candidatus Yonathbacteria bacterium]